MLLGIRMPESVLKRMLIDFLREDVGLGDITTEAVIPRGEKIRAQIVVKEPAVIAGIYELRILFKMLNIEFTGYVEDGEEVSSGTVIADLKGYGYEILTWERVLLNIIMRMSGIATATRRLVKKVSDAGIKVSISATRKTVPGLRYFDKRSVLIGGGDPHRLRLDDAFLIKDNHIIIAKGIEKALERVKSLSNFSKKIEVEVKNKCQAIQAAKLGADIIMLDNMKNEEAEETIQTLQIMNLRKKVLIEMSGGITEKNILEYAKLCPDVISVGSLTHSVRSIDFSLEVIEKNEC
jgi:nicotinate-nucleotide pyrophosphorylase (carboxylating)